MTTITFREWLGLREQLRREALMGKPATGTDNAAWQGEESKIDGPSLARRNENSTTPMQRVPEVRPAGYGPQQGRSR
jgi:hypothetical protein